MFIAKSIAEVVEKSLQSEYYSDIRNILAFHPRAKEITETMALAWFDLHNGGEPSRLLNRLASLQNETLPPAKERLALVLALLHSGYTAFGHSRLRQG